MLYNHDWLSDLKKGDVVLVLCGPRNDPVKHGRVLKVVRTTKTLVVLEGESRYRRRDGYEARSRPAGAFSLEYLVQATDDILAERRRYRNRRKAISYIQGADLTTMSDRQLGLVVTALKEKQC